MGGMFRSSEAAQVTLMTPFHVTTTSGSVSVNTYATNASLNAVALVKPDGNYALFLTAFDSLPGSVTLHGNLGSNNPISFVFDSSLFSINGVYTVFLASNEIANLIPQMTTFQWGGIVDTLANGADSANSAKTLAANAYKFDEGGTSGKLTVYDVDGTTPLAHWLCYSDAARTTLATTWASVVARGPSTPGA